MATKSIKQLKPQKFDAPKAPEQFPWAVTFPYPNDEVRLYKTFNQAKEPVRSALEYMADRAQKHSWDDRETIAAGLSRLNAATEDQNGIELDVLVDSYYGSRFKASIRNLAAAA